MDRLFTRLFPFILLIIISFLYTWPFFQPGFFTSHDGEWAVIRLAEMQREIKDGQLPPRWAGFLNHGYGYPLFHFTYPFPYYLGLIPRALGVGFIDSVKLIFVGSVVISATAMYLLGRELSGSFGGFIASVFYIAAPFRLVNLYVRGSIGESLSLAIIPLLFYAAHRYIVKPTTLRLALTSLLLGVLILTHNITALVVLPIFAMFYTAIVATYFEDFKKFAFRFIIICGLGLGISSYFFLPALIEKKYIALSLIPLADVRQHFIQLKEFINSSWSYGNRPSFALGWLILLTAFIGMIAVGIAGREQRKKYLPLLVFLLISIGGLVFLTNKSSFFFWGLPPLSWIDFPWRFLTPLTFILSLSTIFVAIHRRLRYIGVAFCLITAFVGLQFAIPSEYFSKPDEYYFTNDATTTSADELMPLWVIDKPHVRFDKKVTVKEGDASITDLYYDSHKIQFHSNASLGSRLLINTIYFPGWEFTIDQDKTEIDYSNPMGIMSLNVSEGEHEVMGMFTRTPVRAISELITLCSLIFVAILIIKSLLKQ